jgi:hypothetical protein
VGKRIVLPELLDRLPADDPEALRSRRDLRRINALMGNESWICRTIRKFPEIAAKGIVEFGSGDGILLGKLARMFPHSRVTGFDLAPRPASLVKNAAWMQGDLFSQIDPPTGGILVANLFLHHFEGESLNRLGTFCEKFDLLIFNEPERGPFPHVLGKLMTPMINRVTRHDMHVSIDAGFQTGEIAELMNLSAKCWEIQEHSTWRGARRVLGCRV